MDGRRKIRLTVAYDGTDYHGWQIQPGFRTVQATLCEAVTSAMGCPTHVQGASRTDAGVHARGQVGLISTTDSIPADQLCRAVNDRLPRDIIVRDAREVGPDFDVIGDVTRKAYRYSILTGRQGPVQPSRFCWHFPGALDVESMHAAAQCLLGTRDFRTFVTNVDKSRTTTRTLYRCDVIQAHDAGPGVVAIEMEADGFLRHMARLIVGTLTGIGRGRWSPEHMTEILAACDRTAAGHLAPACGLCLEWIRYRQDEPGHDA